jgi:hypothetical protein
MLVLLKLLLLVHHLPLSIYNQEIKPSVHDHLTEIASMNRAGGCKLTTGIWLQRKE